MKKPTHVYAVKDPEGRIWEDTVAFDEDACKAKFVNAFFGHWQIGLSSHHIWGIWHAFEVRQFTIQTIPLPED